MATRTRKPVRVEQPMVQPVVTGPVVQEKKVRSMFGTILLLGIGLGLGLVIGSLWTKVKYLEMAAANGQNLQAGQQQQQQAPPQVQVSMDTVKGLFSNNDLIRFGDANKKLLLVEVADPSCPYCHAAAGLNPELSRQMGTQFKLSTDGGTYISPVIEMKKLVDQGKASFVYIYSNGHNNGELGATALFCAHDQNKFWQAHDKLMSNAGYEFMNNTKVKYEPSSMELQQGYQKITDSNMDSIATFLSSAGVNTKDLASCLKSRKYVTRLTSDMTLASSLGVNGTPGFFINTKNFSGAYSWTEMKPIADAAVK